MCVAKKRLVRFVLAVLGVLLLIAGIWLASIHVSHLVSRKDLLARRTALEQIGLALKMYANESKGGRYPPKAAAADAFYPDLTLFSPYLQSVPNSTELLSRLTDKARPLCYLGYMVFDDETAFSLLREEDQLLAPSVRPHSPSKCIFQAHRLTEGIGRFLITDVGNPANAASTDGKVPLLWEMPWPNQPSEAWVLFMDGHADLLPYPGPFPLTERFVRAVRSLMGIDDPPLPESEFQTFPPNGSPIAEQAYAILDAVNCWDTGRFDWRILQCDCLPSVLVDGRRGYHVEIGRANNRRQPSTTDWTFEVILTTDPSISRLVEAVPVQPRLIFMGDGMGYRWFSNAEPAIQHTLRNACGLVGGEDLYKLFAAAARLKHATDAQITRMPATQHPGDRPHSSGPTDELATFETYLAGPSGFVEGQPIPEELRDAEAILWDGLSWRWDLFVPEEIRMQAKEVILHSENREAAALIALDLILTRDFGRGRPHIQGEGLDLLRELPAKAYLPMLEHLAGYLGNEEQRVLCQELIEELKAETYD